MTSEALGRLRDLLKPGASFWREHGYNETVGSGESGYFSYLHPLQPAGGARTWLDLVIQELLELLKPHFPKLEAARFAEWWAHCRPHHCGHQLHYDSDDEGQGGARHPLVSSAVFVDAPSGVGGPTLVTTQRLGDEQLAREGWLVHPQTGRVVSFDGSVLHGVVPGRGEGPAAVPSSARRITWMVAFWDEIKERPFGVWDGLGGSSRPLPDLGGPATFGSHTYTWQQQLRLPDTWAASSAPAMCQKVDPTPVTTFKDVWCRVGAEEAKGSSTPHFPHYSDCFQW